MAEDPDGQGGTAQVMSQVGNNPQPAQPESVTGVNTLPGESSAPYAYAAPTEGVGIPDGRIGTQDQVTEIGQYAANFHNKWLLLLCAAISIVVLGLLLYAIVKFRRGANPTPSRTSHNTLVEVVWTVVPVLILVAIAVPSIRLMKRQYNPPAADVTIKVIGNQWYWTYQYPDNGGFELVSNMLKEGNDPALQPGQRARKDNDGPPLLAVDERMVIPAGKVVKFLVTSNDVIHSFAVPAFWTKIDANPGQINETWVKVDRPGVYFGQCSELCGARHAYMPIAVEVVPPAQFAAWVASKGGTMPGPKPVANPIAAIKAVAKPAGGTPAEAAPNAEPTSPTQPAPPTPGAANRAANQN
ncbi:cytochrome c oxidase subunit II [Sphingomonas sinipercae]|uniref:Cytochrome c oxidase subunit 2 n=2 Tax=Sphingomonas sinipercae TaxID=2714944 RepID=A0A6G7ZQF4_9SPHN|nr:cytochrome c oxidase subunit II [Sphingomonas sinipercae]